MKSVLIKNVFGAADRKLTISMQMCCRRHKVVNMFNVMLQKKLRKDDDDAGTGEDSEAKEKKGKKNSNLVSA